MFYYLLIDIFVTFFIWFCTRKISDFILRETMSLSPLLEITNFAGYLTQLMTYCGMYILVHTSLCSVRVNAPNVMQIDLLLLHYYKHHTEHEVSIML